MDTYKYNNGGKMSSSLTDDFHEAMKKGIWLTAQPLYDLSDEEYTEYIKSSFDVDHHDQLRLQRGKDRDVSLGLAANLEQLNMIISYLEFLREKMAPKAKWKFSLVRLHNCSRTGLNPIIAWSQAQIQFGGHR